MFTSYLALSVDLEHQKVYVTQETEAFVQGLEQGTKVRVSLPNTYVSTHSASSSLSLLPSSNHNHNLDILAQIFNIYLKRLTMLPIKLEIQFSVEVDNFKFDQVYASLSSLQNDIENPELFASFYKLKLEECINDYTTRTYHDESIRQHTLLNTSHVLAVSPKLALLRCPYTVCHILNDENFENNHDLSVTVTVSLLECSRTSSLSSTTTMDSNGTGTGTGTTRTVVTSTEGTCGHIPLPGVSMNNKEYIIGVSLLRYVNSVPLLDQDDDATACALHMSLKAVNWSQFGCKLQQHNTRVKLTTQPSSHLSSTTSMSNTNTNSRKIPTNTEHTTKDNMMNSLTCSVLHKYIRSPSIYLQSLYPTQDMKDSPLCYHIIVSVDVHHNSGRSCNNTIFIDI